VRQFASLSYLVVLFLLSSPVLSQQAPPPSQNQVPAQNAKRDWREVWRNATVAFGEIAHDTTMNHNFFHALGTGVIVTTGLHTAYLVTARHVFCDDDTNFHPSQLQLRFAWQERKSIYDYFGIPITLRDGPAGANLWSSLDDGSDIAAIRMPPTDSALPQEDRLKTYDAVSIEDINSDVYEGESILIFGYPGLVGNEKLVRAIVRQGIVAWTNPSQPEEKVFLVDANLYPGNSGGPVIKVPFGLNKDGSFNYLTGGSFKLLGIVSKAPTEDIKTTVTVPRVGQVETHTAVTGIGAIGFIEPASKIRKLIDAMENGTAKIPVCDVSDPQKKQAVIVSPN
jgi:hypothetical protein